MPHSTGSTHTGGHWSASGPPTPILAASFLLAGLGTVVLGPLLPQLLHDWSLTDQRGGLLLLAKFIGAFCGGAAVPRRLRIGIVAGHGLAALGFGAFAFAHSLPLALPALFLTGLGLGEIIASTNILAGRLWPTHAGSALAILNFFWSLGAVSTGLVLAALLPRTGWHSPVLALAGLYSFVGLLNLLSRRQVPGEPVRVEGGPAPETNILLPARLSLTYGSLLFFYGGLETCLTAWLTTFSLRFAGGHLLGGQSGFVVLWAALTAGRVLASALMRRFPEAVVQRVSLALSLVMICVLADSHTAATLSLSCVLLGIALAPVFPSTFALLIRHEVQPRTAGTLLAVSGLGAALFPWLMGVVSTHFGSLRLAMAVPALLIPAMLIASKTDSQNGTAFPPKVPGKGEESAKLAI